MEIAELLASVRRRWVTARAMRAAARVASGALLALALLLAADRLFAPGDLVMIAAAASGAAAAGVLAVTALRPLRHIPGDRQVARRVEECCPELEDRLASAIDLDGERSPFRDLLLADAAHRSRAVDADRVVAARDVRRAIAGAAGVTAAVVAMLVIGSSVFGRIARSAWLYAVPFSATLIVEPGNARVAAGEPLEIKARVADTYGSLGRARPAVHIRTGDGSSTALTMEPRVDGYGVLVPAVDDSFAYRVSAAALVSEDYVVTALQAPRVERIDVAYRYPLFTGLAPRVAVGGGDVFAPEGTAVTLTVHAGSAVREGTLRLASGARLGMTVEAPGVLSASFEVTRDDAYRIALRDGDGLSNAERPEHVIRTVPDDAPVLEIRRPGGDREITSIEEVEIEVHAEDDFGLHGVELVYAVAGSADRVVDLLGAEPAARVTGTHTLFVEDLHVAPGDVISYHARARDANPGRAGAMRSPIYFLEVRPFNREFEYAPSSSLAGMNADAAGRLAELQKEIVAATWRLDQQEERRRSPADLESVADAQAELRQSALGAAAAMLRRGRSAEEREAMAAAARAMARAEAELRALATATALPPELDALTRLRQAEAAIRRTQVSFSGSPGQAGYQPREDLSSMFDRDLRREQQTNYENRPAATQSGRPTEESEALRRVRELAARQEALRRAQADLARRRDSLAGDEAERILARLTREQEELSGLAAALEREIEARTAATQSGSASRSTGASRSSGFSGPSGGASDPMGRALSALRRGRFTEAADRVREALDRLRAMERALDLRSGAGRSQVLGALEREARHLADEQRQLARDARAGRQPGAPPGDPRDGAHPAPGGQEDGNAETRAEARRVLGDRQNALADRVVALHERLEAVAREALERDREAFRAAARSLETGAVVSRMRQIARRFREPPPGESLEGTARQHEEAAVAAIITEVAERLQATATGAAADDRLSAELRAAAEMRRSLEAIERQLAGIGTEDGRTPAELPSGQPGRAADGPGDDGGAGEGHAATGGGTIGAAARALLRQLEASPGLTAAVRLAHPDVLEDLERWAAHRFTGAGAGTEAFKQDFAAWEILHDGVRHAVEAFEADRASALRRAESEGRLAAGSADATPDEYRALVDRYYRSLADRSPRRPAGSP